MTDLVLNITENPYTLDINDTTVSAGTTLSLMIAQGIPSGNYIAVNTKTANEGAVAFLNSNGLTFGMDSLNQITASVLAGGGVGFNATLGGNSTSAGAGYIQISSGTATLAGGNNITLSQNGNAITFVGRNVPTVGTTVYDVTNSNYTGVQTRYAAEDHYHAGVRKLQISGNTLGDTAGQYGDWVIAGGNNITISASTAAGGGTMTISGPNTVAQSVQPAVGSLNGSSGSLTIVVGGALGLTNDASTISITAPAQSVQPAVGSLNGSSGSLTIVAGGAIGLTNNASTISISAPAQTVQTQNLHNATLAGNSTSAGAGFIHISSGTMTLAGGNNITLSQNGNAITISGVNTVAQTVQTQNMVAISASNNLYSSGTVTLSGGNNITVSTNGQVISVVGPANILNSLSVSGNTGTTNSSNITGGGFVLAGGNNITLSQSNNTISIVGNTPVAQTNQTLSIAATAQSAGNTSAVTVDARSLTIRGFGNVSAGISTSAGGTSLIFSGQQTVQTQNLHNLTLAGNSTSAGAGFVHISSGTATLAGGNNVTLSQNGNAITISAANQTVQTQNMIDVTLAGNSTSAGGGYILISSGTLTLAGGNNITLSQNGNAVTISAPNVGGAQTGISSIAASNTTYTSGGITITGTNAAIVRSTTGQGIVIDVPAAVNALSLSGNTATTNSSQITSGGFALAGGNNVTLQQSNNTISISVGNYITTGALSSQTLAFSLSGNTATTNSSQILNGGYALAGGNNVTLQQSNNTISISAANQTVQTQNLHNVTLAGNSTSAGAGYIHISSGTMTLAGGNNITLSQNGNAITISAGAAGGAGAAVSIGGNSTSAGAGYSNITSGTAVLMGGNNITLSQNGASITISAANSGNALTGVSLSGNTATTNSSNITAGGWALAGGNGVTLQQSNNTISVSVATNYQSQGAYLTTAAQSTQTLAFSLSGNTATTNSSNITAGGYALAGGANVTLQQSNNTISISAAAQTVQTQSRFNLTLGGNSTSAGGGFIQISSGVMTLAGGNNVTLSQNGNAVTVSAANSGNAITGLSLGGNSATTNSSNITAGGFVLAGGNNVTLNQSNGTISISAFNQTVQTQNMIGATLAGNSTSAGAGYVLMTSGTMTLAGGNNITLSQNGNAVTVSAANQTRDTAGIYAAGNTTGQSSSSTYDIGTLNVSGAGIASVGWSNGSLIVSVPAGGGGGDGVNIVSMLTSTSGGGTAGATFSTLSGSIGLMAGSNITLSQTSNTINIVALPSFSAGISNIGNTSNTSGMTGTRLVLAGGDNITLSQSNDANGATITIEGPNAVTGMSTNNRQLGASATSTFGQNSIWMSPVRVGIPISGSTMAILASFTGSVTSNVTHTVAATLRFALYSQNSDPASSSIMNTWWTSSVGLTFWNSGTASVSYAYGTLTSSSAGSNLLTASVYGLRILTLNMNSIVPPGLYVGAFMVSTNSTGGSSNMRSFLHIIDNPLPTAMGMFGAATNATNGYVDGGTYSVTSSNFPTQINLTDIRQTLNAMPYFKVGAI